MTANDPIMPTMPPEVLADVDAGAGAGASDLAPPVPSDTQLDDGPPAADADWVDPGVVLGISPAFLADFNALKAETVKRIICNALRMVRNGIQPGDVGELGTYAVTGSPNGTAWSVNLSIRPGPATRPGFYVLDGEESILGC